jgi:hypothetical protein
MGGNPIVHPLDLLLQRPCRSRLELIFDDCHVTTANAHDNLRVHRGQSLGVQGNG